jgi:hypothetical protein
MKHNLNLIKKKYSEKTLEKNIDLFNYEDWFCIARFQKLSEKFIEKYSDKLNWYYISGFQNLSEEFMEKHSNKICWFSISLYQKLSEEFIKKHINKIDVEELMYNKRVSKKTKNKIKKEINLLKEII